MKYFVLFLILLSPVVFSFAQNTDIDILRKINLGRNKGSDNVFLTITSSVTPISILAPISVICEGYTKHDSTLTNKGIYIGATLILAAGISTGLKYSVNRKRPFVTYPDIEKVGEGGSKSFPSGHTSDAFATATSLSLAFPKWYVIAPSFVWACSVGYSRMDLGVHYPSDVLAGAVVGAGTAFICYKANRWIHTKKQRKYS
jgi:membrane-associated phospholipid phosphatase